MDEHWCAVGFFVGLLSGAAFISYGNGFWANRMSWGGALIGLHYSNGPGLPGRVSTLRHTVAQTNESTHVCPNEHFTFSEGCTFTLCVSLLTSSGL